MVLSEFVGLLQRSSLWLVVTSVIFFATSACQSQKTDFCTAAIEFRDSLDQIDTRNTFKLLDEKFWKALKSEVDNLADSTDGELQDEIYGASAKLDKFIQRLDDVDYNILAAITDPEVSQNFSEVLGALRTLASSGIRSAIKDSC